MDNIRASGLAYEGIVITCILWDYYFLNMGQKTTAGSNTKDMSAMRQILAIR